MSTLLSGTRGIAATSEGKPTRGTRRRKRLKVSLPVHLRPYDVGFRELQDVGLVVNFTRNGMHFTTCMPHYFVGMRLDVTFPYGDKVAAHRKFIGLIVRMEDHGNGQTGVSVQFLL
jgi:hypothetical protein